MDQNIPVLIYIQKLKRIESILVDIKPATVANDIALTKITEFLKECEHKDNESKTTFTEDKHCVDCGDYIMPLDWCGCTDPNDANYKGYSCPKCSKTRMKCECEELQND